MSDFRLATVERLREQRLQVCAQDLHAATAAVTAALQVREAIQSRLLQTPALRTTSPDELLRDSMFRERLRGDLLAAGQEIGRLSGVLAERRAAWLHAHSQYRAITALHERHRLARRAAIARQEQIEVDELAGTRRPIGIGGGA